jgi:S1-C subfamily serine protease
MGIMPSYTADEEGLKVDGVSEGKPAQKAGVLAGDVIIQMGDVVVKDIQNYMDALGKFDKGQTVPIKLKRKGEVLTLNVTF